MEREARKKKKTKQMKPQTSNKDYPNYCYKGNW